MGSKLLLKLLLRLLAPALVLALVVVLLVRLEIIENPVRFVAEELGIVSRTKTAGSTLLLEELRSIYRLNTMEYIYRTVFPFDYMPETTDYSEVMNTIRNSAVPAGEALTEDQRLYFDAANLAEDVGLEEEEFLVLTVRVFAGFDLENTSHGDGATTENASEAASRGGVKAGTTHAEASEGDVANVGATYEGATISRDEETGRRVAHVRIPPASVTDVVIEDVDPESYAYPDVGMDAEQWRAVAAFVAENVEARTIEEGVLEAAGENARELTRNLLMAAGIDQVSFANERNNSPNSEDRR